MNTTIRRTAVVSAALTAMGVTAFGPTADAAPATDYPIPNVASRSIAGMPQHADFGQSPRVPAMSGAMVCDPGNPTGLTPVAGRSWMYWSGSGTIGDPSADVTVTGWKDGAAALAGIGSGKTHCLLQEGWHRTATTPLAQTYANGTERAVVTRVQNLLVSVVADKGSGSASLAAARDEATKISGRLTLAYPPAA